MTRVKLTVGGITVEPGQRAYGYLHVGYLAARTEVRIPLQVLNGATDGPVVCLEATLHGWEPMGAEILRRALQRIDPAQLRGTIYCLPLANPYSVEFGGTVESTGTRVNPADLLDLNRVWPGKLENGWLTEQMARVIWTEVLCRCQYLVDYHDGTGACDELPVAFPQAIPEDAVVESSLADGVGGEGEAVRLTAEYIQNMNSKIRGMAEAFGSPVIWWRQNAVNSATISGHCLLHNIVPLVVEAGGGGQIDYTIEQGVECTLNILKHLGMIEGDLVLPRRQIMVERYNVRRSRTGGFYLQEEGIALGAVVTKGQLLGRVLDPLTSEVMEECHSPVNGIIISRRLKMPINPGGYIAHIADTDSIVWTRDNS